ncbi:MAG TPA: hypothetical protein VN451_11840, partial [Chitinophagaceae bacterium]|nr:hypothetical protein [Chitinophagaceae bacterium]
LSTILGAYTSVFVPYFVAAIKTYDLQKHATGWWITTWINSLSGLRFHFRHSSGLFYYDKRKLISDVIFLATIV